MTAIVPEALARLMNEPDLCIVFAADAARVEYVPEDDAIVVPLELLGDPAMFGWIEAAVRDRWAMP